MGFKMKVDILFLEAGAREAARRGSVTIVVDAIRASATATTALALGARDVIPVLSADEAAMYVGRPLHRVAGERNAKKCEGFDFGNSPSELSKHEELLRNHTLVLSTSNGTRIVETARQGAAAVFMATTLNARAVAEAAFKLAQELEEDIVLVGAGEYGQYAEEDAYSARYIASHLHQLGATCPPDFLRQECASTVFHATYSAQELRERGYAHDIDFCAQQDIFDVAPILQGNRLIPFGSW